MPTKPLTAADEDEGVDELSVLVESGHDIYEQYEIFQLPALQKNTSSD